MLTRLLFEKIESEEKPAVLYEQRSCLRSRFNRNDCRACLDECRAGALELNGRTVSFDADKCTGCMRCVAVCPNDAFTAGLELLDILKKLKTAKMILISCRKEKQFVDYVRIPCIGIFSEALIASMNSLARGRIFLDTTHCNTCANAHCLESIKNTLRLLRENETDTGGSLKVKLVPDEAQLPEMDAKQSRRFFLKGTGSALTDLGIETCSRVIEKKDTANEEYRKGPVKNSLFLQFAIDNAKDGHEIKGLETFFYTIEADELCNLCPVCSGMCPTGALKRVTKNGEKHLVFKSADCSGCRLCRDFCKKQALSLRKGFSGNVKEAKQLN